MKIATILDMIDLGSMALPEFQRGYVWNRDQVRGLMQSLYRRYPIGSLLVWVTRSEGAASRGDQAPAPGVVKLLLDGQQRITTLYGIIRGRPPRFFDGNAQAFTGLYFHLEDETFEFYMPSKMKGNPLWINVTELMQNGVGEFISQLYALPELAPNMKTYIQRLTAIEGIKDVDLHVEEVTGEDKTIDVVVDIFNRVNSGGTKLSQGDLALAKICAGWPEARQAMKEVLSVWEKAGFHFNLDWLLRNITTILTGEAFFSALKDVDAQQFQKGLAMARDACNYLLNVISGRLGLDHDRVLGGRYAFPVMARYLVLRGGKLKDARERDRLLYWYVHSFLWGRFAGSTETVLNQDLKVLEPVEGALDRLIEQLRLSRGSLIIRPEDFAGWSLGARFYPMLYLLTRVCGARDWGSGVPLSANLLGKLNALQVHHIFPKALLYDYGYQKAEVNAIANLCFLTQGANLAISDNRPEVYLEEVERRFPGALASQWVPLERELWRVENYRDFLAERRRLLAVAANRFLDELLNGSAAAPVAVNYSTVLNPTTAPVPVEDDEIRALIEWVKLNGLPKPELDFEVCSPTGEVLTIVDLAWPAGVQEGYSQPVALVLQEDKDQNKILNQAGYRYFTSVKDLRAYLETMVGISTDHETSVV
ncbi:DUF262 domain-containing protein [Neomoorella humiferrea]|uniref:GmrSD restriction endonuclease domain-containing protein n=1 Tax=Neomoorella humiferrea TaxID=676965 RepID=UPI003D8B1460